ncbi:hypothetical protein LPJ59_005950 [Coemansia sp. RSA 2399]|nr:hypothetical protein LPJ59_005950 [Coemansia sp. RSA 2399]KAJ1890841.1 hypothetical protein LPJ81_005858 [Coemansia sp. IMI 209127]
MTQTVAVIGATGLQGGSVLHSLHATGKYKLVAVTRNTSSESAKEIQTKYPDVELVAANLDDTESLKKAFNGADFVFGVTLFMQPDILSRISAGDDDAEFYQGKNIADAAIAAGVKNIIFSTLYSIKDLSGGKYPGALHFEKKDKIEQYIRSKSSVIRSAFIQLGFYMDNFVNFSRISPEDGKTVEFTFPLNPTTKLPLVDTAKDTGGVVAHIIDHFDDFVGKTVEVSGGYYEVQDMANTFTEVTGKPARFVQISYEALNNEDFEHMFKSYDEFGYFGWKTDFLDFNKKLSYTHTTPTEFWKNRGWTGPSQ